MALNCPWVIDISCDQSTWDDAAPALQESAAAWAQDILWAATGRQFGACPMTVRPCLGWSGGQQSWGAWDMYGSWYPYIWNGQWYNAFCGCAGMCCCLPRPYTQAWLPTPVVSIVSVDIGGIELDPAAYRVDEKQWLIRQDGLMFPRCQDYNEAAGGVDTWSVTYLTGNVVPKSVLTAAGMLAIEWIKACSGAECQLPSYVTSVIRGGVEMTMPSLMDVMKLGLTGLPFVDQIIRAYNPDGLKKRGRVMSPDLPQMRITTS